MYRLFQIFPFFLFTYIFSRGGSPPATIELDEQPECVEGQGDLSADCVHERKMTTGGTGDQSPLLHNKKPPANVGNAHVDANNSEPEAMDTAPPDAAALAEPQPALDNGAHPPAPANNVHMDDDDAYDDYKPEATLYHDIVNVNEFARGSESSLSEPSMVRGLPWKILAMPRDTNRAGERGGRARALGFFLQCNADSESTSWTCSAQAVLKLKSKTAEIEDHVRRIQHTFYPKENDWGYSQFMLFDTLLDPASGFVKDNTITLEVYVNADAPHGVAWDSKKHTGYIGLKNQGATCYMNSLLQTLFFTNKLRKAVYQMQTMNDDPIKSVPLAMQRVFYELQSSDRPVGTKKLTRSFGWDTFESFLQHDVQELCRVLLDNLETKMKNTPLASTMSDLFLGKMKSYIRCKDVDFESSRIEEFYDIQLNIKNKGRLIDSFQDYVKVEELDGDNKYDAGPHGLQRAEKGVTFVKFPPVLHLQLMRFQYDPIADANVKINDRLEFPEELDLSAFVDESERNCGPTPKYVLHAVLVHSGDFHGGHYVVFINPKGNGKWCKFDDDVVSRVTKREAVEANYGGDEPEMPQRAFTNAYMLVYVRKCDLADLLCPVSDGDVPKRLRERLEEERRVDEQRKKEKNEAHLFFHFCIIDDQALCANRKLDLYDEEIADKTARKFRVPKKNKVLALYDQVADAYNMRPFEQFRLWTVAQPPLGSRSRLRCITPDKVQERITDFAQTYDDRTFCYLERVLSPSHTLKEYDVDNEILVILKYYDVRHRALKCVGHAIFDLRESVLNKIMPELRRMADIKPQQQLQLFEELPPRVDARALQQRGGSATSGDRPSCLQLLNVRGPETTLESFKPELSCLSDGLILVYQIDLSTLPPSTAVNKGSGAEDYYIDILNCVELECFERDGAGCATQLPPAAAAGANPPPYSAGSGQGGNSAPQAGGNQVPVPDTVKAMVRDCPQADGNAGSTAILTGKASLQMRYTDVLKWIAAGLEKRHNQKVDPLKLQLFRSSYGAYDKGSPGPAIAFDADLVLRTVVHGVLKGNERRGEQKARLYFKRIPVPVNELDRRRMMNVQFMTGKMKIEDLTVYPDKTGNVRSILEEVKRLVTLSEGGTGKLRLVAVGCGSNSARVLVPVGEDASVEQVVGRYLNAKAATAGVRPTVDQQHQQTAELRVEEVPQDQLVVEQGKEQLLPVAHYSKEPSCTFGVPFFVKVRQGESFSAVRDRIRRALADVAERDFDKFKFALIKSGKPTPIVDLDGYVVNLTDLGSTMTHGSVWLGLDHMNKTRSSRSHPLEKAIVIHN